MRFEAKSVTAILSGDIFGGLADIHANTLEILRILREEDDEEEDA